MAAPKATNVGFDGLAEASFGLFGQGATLAAINGIGLVSFGYVWLTQSIWIDCSVPITTTWVDC